MNRPTLSTPDAGWRPWLSDAEASAVVVVPEKAMLRKHLTDARLSENPSRRQIGIPFDWCSARLLQEATKVVRLSHGGADATDGIGWKLAAASSQHLPRHEIARQMLHLFIAGHPEGNSTRPPSSTPWPIAANTLRSPPSFAMPKI